MEVVKATIKQLKQLVEIRLEFLKELHFFNQEDEERLRTKLNLFFTNYLNKELFCYVIEKGDQIISSVFVHVQKTLPTIADETGQFGKLLNVYTRPLYRKQGLSRRILNTVIQDSQEKNLDKLELAATKSGYSLYEQVGFTEKQDKYCQMALSLVAL